MADVYSIKRKTLEATGDKIRSYLGTDKYVIDPAVVYGYSNTYGVMLFTQDYPVTVAYREFIDCEGVIFTYENGVVAGNNGDTIVAFEFLENNDGELVPVLYDTHIYQSDWIDDPYLPDTDEKFFYVGKATVDGVLYDRWRKIEYSNGVVSGEFTWDTVCQQYFYTNEIVIFNGYYPSVFPEKIDEIYNKGYEEGKASVVDSPLPAEIETEAEMTAILTNATSASVGAVYKYMGTTGTYTNGELYIIAEDG